MQFVSCDWGTTHFRLRWVQSGRIERESRSEDGVARLAAAGGNRASLFEQTLRRGLESIGAPAGIPVCISGMASASIGWQELPYATLPFPLDGRGARLETVIPGVTLISGLRSPRDVMRGEETELLGLAARRGQTLPDPCTVILPGTHSKHLRVERGAVRDFQTHLTGELYDLLARQSVLRHSVDLQADFDESAFSEGVLEARSQPLTAALFRVRTRQVLDGRSPGANASFLSGLLIGAELLTVESATGPLLLAAGERLRRAYATAAQVLGFRDRLQLEDSADLCPLGQQALLKHFTAAGSPPG